jgi:hypothetical protein
LLIKHPKNFQYLNFLVNNIKVRQLSISIWLKFKLNIEVLFLTKLLI